MEDKDNDVKGFVSHKFYHKNKTKIIHRMKAKGIIDLLNKHKETPNEKVRQFIK